MIEAISMSEDLNRFFLDFENVTVSLDSTPEKRGPRLSATTIRAFILAALSIRSQT